MLPLRLPLLVLSLLLGGCATVQGPVNPDDPWERFNRGVYSFNDTVDRTFMRPVAEFYQELTPAPVNRGIGNFFRNLDDVTVIINDLLQLKLAQAGFDLGRLAFNSSVGLLGFIDVATPMGLEKHSEDFGQTLGYWGVRSGPYLVLPFFGPSNVRDGVGLGGDMITDPVRWGVERQDQRYGLIVLRAVDTRANLLRTSRILEQAALDPYAFMRDAYLQRRQNQVFDGNPPAPDYEDFELEDKEFFEDFQLEDENL